MSEDYRCTTVWEYEVCEDAAMSEQKGRLFLHNNQLNSLSRSTEETTSAGRCDGGEILSYHVFGSCDG